MYFEAGKLVFAEDDAPGETFGRLLMRQGVITNDQFVRVIDAMTLAAKGDNPLRFGEVAVGQGVLTIEQVERGLADQVCGIIGRALQRDESRGRSLLPGAPKPPRIFSIDVDALISAAMLRLPEVVPGRPGATGPAPSRRGAEPSRRTRRDWPPSRPSRRAWRCFARRKRWRRPSSCAAPPCCSRNLSNTRCAPAGRKRVVAARYPARPINARCWRSRRGRRNVTRCSPSDRTSSGNSRCGRVTMPRPRNGSTRR